MIIGGIVTGAVICLYGIIIPIPIAEHEIVGASHSILRCQSSTCHPCMHLGLYVFVRMVKLCKGKTDADLGRVRKSAHFRNVSSKIQSQYK
jgi:hypothetical protein